MAVNRPARADSIAHAAIGTALNSQGVAAGYFAGTVDEVRIWNYSRTAAQIAAGRDREIASANGLLGRWSFNECCTDLVDSSSQSLSATLFGSSWTWVAGGPLTGIANAAPNVAAGEDRMITLPAAASLNGAFTDDGLSGNAVTTQWTHTSGPGVVTFANRHCARDDRQLLPRGNLRPDAHGDRRRAVGQRLRFNPC